MAVSLSPAQRALLPDTMSVSASDPFTLELAGHSLKQLAERYGTPLYIFDRATIVNACAQYREAFRREYQASSVQILYASKAYLSPMIARLVAEEGLGLDVVSGGELLVAHRAAFPMERISFHGNNKSAEELRLALRLGVGRIVLDNWSELRRLTQIAREMQMHPGVLVRVAPDVETDTHRYLQTGHATAKFGFPLSTGDAAEAVRTILHEGQLHVLGLHAHSGTMLRETRPYEECLQRLLELAVLLHKETGWWPQELSPGGGWAIATPDAPDRPDPALLAAALQRCILHCVDTLKISQPLPMLIIEPGRSIIARAGIALYRIGARKATPGGITYLFVDGGMADNIRPALYGALYTALPVEQLEREHDVSFCVSGRYCESGDMLIEEVRLPDMREGELLLLPTAGAYCLPMASNYNLVPRPGVLLVDKETIHVMERRETYDDLLSRYCD